MRTSCSKTAPSIVIEPNACCRCAVCPSADSTLRAECTLGSTGSDGPVSFWLVRRSFHPRTLKESRKRGDSTRRSGLPSKPGAVQSLLSRAPVSRSALIHDPALDEDRADAPHPAEAELTGMPPESQTTA